MTSSASHQRNVHESEKSTSYVAVVVVVVFSAAVALETKPGDFQMTTDPETGSLKLSTNQSSFCLCVRSGLRGRGRGR